MAIRHEAKGSGCDGWEGGQHEGGWGARTGAGLVDGGAVAACS